MKDGLLCSDMTSFDFSRLSFRRPFSILSKIVDKLRVTKRKENRTFGNSVPACRRGGMKPLIQISMIAVDVPRMMFQYLFAQRVRVDVRVNLGRADTLMP